ncbi:hypothetical protein NKR23_g8984 [Pleurostoma richardsiae]|uniref:Uncharacterized protein n=1 Tax=Pleurostoma richardsiae TaxID=41990 RepID=A0AA38VKD4_9PEZI|nr:hypothetical protein NKR23_g8984 [Pleurostoma richardsiae]
MGCGISKGAESGQALTPGWDAHATATDVKTDQAQRTVNIVPLGDDLPEYAERDPAGPPSSIDIILGILQEANRIRECGINGAFNVLRERHFDVWIDSSYLLPEDSRGAIELLATLLLAIGKAYDCYMTIYFTNHPNKKSKELSEEDKMKLEALLCLWHTGTWREAVALVKANATLRDLGFGEWIAQRDRDDDEDGSQEKHVSLLSCTRSKMQNYWYGYHLREVDMPRLNRLFNSAIRSAEKQPKCLNNVCFTYQRTIKRYQRIMKQGNAPPVTSIFLLGSGLQPTEVDAIQHCLTQGANFNRNVAATHFSRRPGGPQEDRSERWGTQFRISAMVMGQHLSQDALNNYRRIDDFAHGDNDINDQTTVAESKILEKLIGARALFKMLNCHNALVDRSFHVDGKALYGNQSLCGDITTPSVAMIKRALHLEKQKNIRYDDDDDDDANVPGSASDVRIQTSE